MSKRKDRAAALQAAVTLEQALWAGTVRSASVEIKHRAVLNTADTFYQYIRHGKRL